MQTKTQKVKAPWYDIIDDGGNISLAPPSRRYREPLTISEAKSRGLRRHAHH